MENKILMQVGDPSKDGHNQHENVYFKSNKTIQEIKQAYKQACELTGLVFTENTDVIFNGEKLKWDNPEYNARRICVDYEHSEISELARTILEWHGIEPKHTTDLDSVSIVDLFLKFIKLVIKDLEWEFIKNDTPLLNITIGYGLFD